MFLRDNPQFLESIDEYMINNSTIKETIGEDSLDIAKKVPAQSPPKFGSTQVKFSSTFNRTIGFKAEKQVESEGTKENTSRLGFITSQSPQQPPIGIAQAIKKYQTSLDKHGAGISPRRLVSHPPTYLDKKTEPIISKSPMKIVDRKVGNFVVQNSTIIEEDRRNLNNVFGMPLKSHWVFKGADQIQPGEIAFRIRGGDPNPEKVQTQPIIIDSMRVSQTSPTNYKVQH